MFSSNTSIPRNNTFVPRLIVLCGPTATGKSGLAIALAQRLNSGILSADSRQVYREFNIGTAKPSIAEQQQVPHYLIDICDPTETLTLAEYQQQAQTLIEAESGEMGKVEEIGREKEQPFSNQNSELKPQASSLKPQTSNLKPQTSPLLLVGGTGLYIRSIVHGLKIPRVSPHLELRSQLQSLGQTQLYAMLQQVDAASADKIHPNDQVRTLRALEVFYVTGNPISSQQGENPPTYPILQIGLDCQNSTLLKQRIEQRTHQMVADGLVDEVQVLWEKYGTDLPLLNTLGYAEVKQYLTGDRSLDSAIAETVLHTRQFAKRQRTWFRAYPKIEWFDADSPDLLEKVWQRVQAFLDGNISDRI